MPDIEEEEADEVEDEEEEEDHSDADSDFVAYGRSPSVFHVNRSNVSGFLHFDGIPLKCGVTVFQFVGTVSLNLITPLLISLLSFVR